MEKSRVGPFLINGRLGQEEDGCAYQAIHVEQRKAVALKLFAAPFAMGKELGAEFAREWEVLQKLRHPHIVRCYGGGFDELQAYLAYELVRGETLAAMLQRRGRLSWEQVVEYGLQIVEGLECAHAQGVVHQSLRPDKLLVTEADQIQVADFRVDRQGHATFQSPAKRTVESIAYLAPEQLHLPPQVSPQSDLYALGCILYELLTGNRPQLAETSEALIELKQNAAVPRVATIAFDCPIWLDALVSQLLATDPAQRPHTAAAVRLALVEVKRRMAAGTSVTEHAASGLSALKTQADKGEARKLLGRDTPVQPARPVRPRAAGKAFYEQPWFLAICVALLGLVALGVGAWALWPLSEEQLISRADKLMVSENKRDWDRARHEYLDPLLKRFPGGKSAPRARAHIDAIEMDLAEARLRIKTRLNKERKSEGERLYAEASKYEQDDDRLTALEKYQSLVTLLSEEGEDRPYVQLAKRQIAKLTQDKSAGDRAEFLKGRLAKADELAAQGEALEARKIWQSMVTLYGENRDLQSFVERAQAKLAEKEAKK